MVDPVLARLPLFSDLAEAEIESVSAVMRRRRYAKGSLIHAAGAMGADFYVIESGRVKVQLATERGEALTLRLLGPADFFGEISLFDEEPWYGDVVAVDDCRLLLLAKRDFLAVIDKYPSVSRKLLTVICRRLRHNASFARDLAFLDVPTRLARAIVVLVESEGWGWTSDQWRQDSRLAGITQSDLAGLVGATRESINKWLGYYERRGYISRKRDGIVVLRLDELRSRARVELATTTSPTVIPADGEPYWECCTVMMDRPCDLAPGDIQWGSRGDRQACARRSGVRGSVQQPNRTNPDARICTGIRFGYSIRRDLPC